MKSKRHKTKRKDNIDASNLEKRTCLKCRKDFNSEGSHNRICRSCVKNFEPSYSKEHNVIR